MNVELLELLELDDLQGEVRELAECIGMEAFRRLLERYGGTGKMYIPQPDKVVIPVRDVLIRREYNGYNTYELARKWNLSDAYVRQIVKDKAAEIRRAPPDGQLAFDDFPQKIGRNSSPEQSIKDKELRRDLSFLEQNARDAGMGMEQLHNKAGELYAVTGDTNEVVEALSNILATGFDDADKAYEAVDLLAGAVVKFPETMKIESLADSLQETIATGEATGQFSELLGRLGVDVEKFNERLGRTRSEASRQNLALQTLRKEGLDELWESYKTGNSDMIEAEKANYNLQLRYVELAKSIEPIETKIKTTFAQVLLDHEDQILAIVDAAGEIIGVGADVIGFLSELNPAVVLVSGGLALIAVKATGTALGMRIVATGTASATKALAAAGPTAAAAGSQFVMLAADLLMVGAAVFLVTSGIAMLISAIRGVPMINTGTIQVPSMGELQAQTGRGYARGTRSAAPGWRWVGENGPELMRFAGGEAVYTAEQSRALISAQGGGTTFVDNSQNIFKVDDIETYVAIKRMLENEKMTVRMGLARR